MRSLVPLLRVARAWLTAITVLVAGSPSISCLCPDGHRKLFCLHSPAELGGCCGSSCCAGRSPEEKSCCRGHKERGDAPSDNRSRVDAAGCSKVLTPPALIAISTPSDTDDGGAPAGLLDFAPSPDSVIAPLGPTFHPLLRPSNHSPPSPDLIVTLRHFVI
jgi:hypothetical protein